MGKRGLDCRECGEAYRQVDTIVFANSSVPLSGVW